MQHLAPRLTGVESTLTRGSLYACSHLQSAPFSLLISNLISLRKQAFQASGGSNPSCNSASPVTTPICYGDILQHPSEGTPIPSLRRQFRDSGRQTTWLQTPTITSMAVWSDEVSHNTHSTTPLRYRLHVLIRKGGWLVYVPHSFSVLASFFKIFYC